MAAAAERAKRQLALEKQRREAEEKQRQQREVSTYCCLTVAAMGLSVQAMQQQAAGEGQRQQQGVQATGVDLMVGVPL